MKFDEKTLKKLLLDEHYLDQSNLEKAEEYAVKHHCSFLDYLFLEGVISKYVLGQALAEFFHTEYADFQAITPSKEEILKIPEEIARKYRAIFFQEDAKFIKVATDDPSSLDLQQELQNLFPQKECKILFGLTEDIDQSLLAYNKPLNDRFAQILKQQDSMAPAFLEEIIRDALIYGASDVHFEPQEKEVNLRFRVDGMLSDIGKIPRESYENIVNRIKVQAKLRIDTHNAVQDGAMRFLHNGKSIDLRVSIAPVLDGEKVVMRVLSEYVRSFNLLDLGLSLRQRERLMQAAKKPFGMVLTTGPTGSGKTTTLYALLKLLNQPNVNITTIEDPVEYKLSGINQIQVNQLTGMTFAQGLRSIVRQDPNIILVGEIRDRETAEIAVNAALTGHLLLSTFHANDAATAIPRLLDMGIEPFLLASTLEIIIAQRLVRKICEQCRSSYLPEVSELKRLFPNGDFAKKQPVFYRGKGCQSCNQTGFKGRVAIYEIIQITPELQDVILKNPSSREIWEIAFKEGATTLFENGYLKIEEGITTPEELLRIATPQMVVHNSDHET